MSGFVRWRVKELIFPHGFNMSAWRFEEGEADVAEADFKNGLGGFGEGGTRLSPPEDDEVDVGDADPAAIMAFSSSILDHSHQGATISPKNRSPGRILSSNDTLTVSLLNTWITTDL